MDANRRPSQGALRSPGDGFQEECVQPGKFPAVRSARDADTSFSTQPGPEAESCAAGSCRRLFISTGRLCSFTVLKLSRLWFLAREDAMNRLILAAAVTAIGLS